MKAIERCGCVHVLIDTCLCRSSHVICFKKQVRAQPWLSLCLHSVQRWPEVHPLDDRIRRTAHVRTRDATSPPDSFIRRPHTPLTSFSIAVVVTASRGRSQYLEYRVEQNLEPKLIWLQEQVGVDDKGLGKMILAAPNILGLSIEANLKPKLRWIKDALGLDKRATARLLVQVPSILHVSSATLNKKLEFLQGEDVNLSKVRHCVCLWTDK